MTLTHLSDKLDLLDTKTLAALLDVTPDWLRRNRKSDNPIPYRVIGRRSIRYTKLDVLEWVGRKDLILKFYSTKTLAQKLSFSESWLNHNRLSDHPIPFRRFGGLVRYNETEVRGWIKKSEFFE